MTLTIRLSIGCDKPLTDKCHRKNDSDDTKHPKSGYQKRN